MPFFDLRTFVRAVIAFALCMFGWIFSLAILTVWIGTTIWDAYSGTANDHIYTWLLALIAILCGLLLIWVTQGVLRGGRIRTGLSVVVAIAMSARFIQIAAFKTSLTGQLQTAKMVVFFVLIAAGGLWLTVSSGSKHETR